MAPELALSVSDLKAILTYDRAVFDRYVRRVRRLAWAAAKRKRGIGHESLFATLVHILNVQEAWLVYIVRGRNSDAELDQLFHDASRRPKDWRGFVAYRRRIEREVDATVRGWTPRDLGRRVSVFWMPGQYTVRDAVLQVTFEEAHHLGEIIGALWQDDIEPPDMTWLDLRRADARRRRR
jgi:uncharacterized damage-inducible protein DinB